MSKTNAPEPFGENRPQPAGADRTAELRVLAAKIDALVSTTGIVALDAALALAASGDPAATDRARSLADDLAERSSRLEQ
jgi:hypothetical protein